MDDPCKGVDGCPLDGFRTACENMWTEKCPHYNSTKRSVILDSGERTEFASGAVRDMHEGKGRFDLLPMCVLMRLARHYEEGAKKYKPRNWEKGIPASSFADSALRHIVKYLDGWNDEDHLIAAIWNLFGLAWTEEKRPDYPVPKGKRQPANSQ